MICLVVNWSTYDNFGQSLVHTFFEKKEIIVVSPKTAWHFRFLQHMKSCKPLLNGCLKVGSDIFPSQGTPMNYHRVALEPPRHVRYRFHRCVSWWIFQDCWNFRKIGWGRNGGEVRHTHRKWIWWIFPPRLGDLDEWSCWLKVAIPWRDVDEKVFKKGVNAGFILLYLPAGRILFWSLPMRCIYDVASYRTHIHILLTTTTIVIITTVITVITFITIITSTLSITIMFTCFIVFLIYNIIRTIIQRCLSVSLWREGHWTLQVPPRVFLCYQNIGMVKNLDTPQHLSKRLTCPLQVSQVLWRFPFKRHRPGSLRNRLGHRTSEVSSHSTALDQQWGSGSRSHGAKRGGGDPAFWVVFFTGPGSSGMTGFEGVDDLESWWKLKVKQLLVLWTW